MNAFAFTIRLWCGVTVSQDEKRNCGCPAAAADNILCLKPLILSRMRNATGWVGGWGEWDEAAMGDGMQAHRKCKM